MPAAPGLKAPPTRGRAFFAGVFVLLTVVGVWKFIDYRMQPPPPPPIRGAAEAH